MSIRHTIATHIRAGLFLCACLAASAVDADVKLPALISDHMVLQADTEVPIWGWANPGESVSVSLGQANANATADQNGKWQAKLLRLSAGGPHTLEVKGSSTLVVKDVLV